MPSTADELVAQSAKSYDEIPYDSMAFDYTQPEHIAAISVLLGCEVTPLENARVLEIGCASAGNLVSFAAKYPNAYCLGVDISEKQIAMGQSFIKNCGLNNIELIALDIRELSHAVEKFDYIICHGVLAWVPTEIQNAILHAIKSFLSDNGIAYVSYNVYPGWHTWEIARHLMHRATAHLVDPKEKVRVAMQAMSVFSKAALNTKDRPIAQILEEKRNKIEQSPLYYVYHEYLESCNYPFYFKDFVAFCADKGLRYLGDSSFSTMFLDAYTDKAEAYDWINNNSRHRYDEEEYMDYLSGRTFRRSLIVHDHQSLDLSVSPERLNLLSVYSYFKPKDEQADLCYEFVKDDDKSVRLTLEDEYSAMVMWLLAEQIPHPVDLPTLLMKVWNKMGLDPSLKSDVEILAGLKDLASFLLLMLKKEVVQVSFQPVTTTSFLSDRPVSWIIAREQASNGQKLLSNLYCKVIASEKIMASCLILADGTNNVATIKSKVGLEHQIEEATVQSVLEKMARMAFLVG